MAITHELRDPNAGTLPSSDATASTQGSIDVAIDVVDLVRTFRKRKGWWRSGELVEAVRGISFSVPQGSIYGVLGPNGAGKTTTIKMLATLLLPTSGTATINGLDIVRDEQRVRKQLGVLFGGDKGLYNQLSGFENLRYFGRLYGMDDATIRQRSDDLLGRVRLLDRADERVESYSRGMKQRLHIAKTLIHDPAVVILDEPTIGLDPGAAIGVRELIADLAPDHTVLLTTHDMHEADTLCREVAIVDQGLIVAQGTPAALKAASGVERGVSMTLGDTDQASLEAVERGLVAVPGVIHASHGLDHEGRPQLDLTCDDTSIALDGALALLRNHALQVSAIDIREPSLEDAFLQATGREFEPESGGDEA
jgi:ABC-2 type transport system ATP-binding protein